jgi:hypothetical protein
LRAPGSAGVARIAAEKLRSLEIEKPAANEREIRHLFPWPVFIAFCGAPRHNGTRLKTRGRNSENATPGDRTRPGKTKACARIGVFITFGGPQCHGALLDSRGSVREPLTTSEY